jgi:hypothetical protein
LASGHIDDVCDLAVGPGGSLYAIWSQDSPSGLDIYYAFRPAGGSWTAPVMVNDVTAGTQTAPRIAVDPDGNAYAVWMDRRGGGADYRIYFSRRPAG